MVGNSPDTGGSSISVTGLNFGSSELTTTLTVRSRDCLTTSWSSATWASCMTANLELPTFAMTVNRLVGTGPRVFSYDAPILTTVVLNIASSGRSSVTVTGLNFGSIDLSASAAAEGYAALSTAWTSATTLQCHDATRTADWPLGSRGYADVTVSALVGTGATSLLSFDAPTLSYVDRNTALSALNRVVLTGLSFGIEHYTATTGSLGSACLTSSWSTATSVYCGIDQSTIAIANRLQLTVNNVVGTLSQLGFSFDGPVVSSAFRNGPLSGGASVTTTGLNFGSPATTPTQRLGDVSICTTSSWSSRTTVQCLSDYPAVPFARPRRKLFRSRAKHLWFALCTGVCAWSASLAAC